MGSQRNDFVDIVLQPLLLLSPVLLTLPLFLCFSVFLSLSLPGVINLQPILYHLSLHLHHQSLSATTVLLLPLNLSEVTLSSSSLVLPCLQIVAGQSEPLTNSLRSMFTIFFGPSIEAFKRSIGLENSIPPSRPASEIAFMISLG